MEDIFAFWKWLTSVKVKCQNCNRSYYVSTSNDTKDKLLGKEVNAVNLCGVSCFSSYYEKQKI